MILIRKALCMLLIAALVLPGAASAKSGGFSLRLADSPQGNGDFSPRLADAPSRDWDWFYEGRSAASSEYSGGGAVVSGVLSGFALGFIGWGIGYAIAANMGADVPHRHTVSLSTTDREMFREGYTEEVKNTRKSRFSTGAAIGTLASVIVVLSSME